MLWAECLWLSPRAQARGLLAEVEAITRQDADAATKTARNVREGNEGRHD